MSPTELVVKHMQRAHLRRLRKAIGVTGYELPEEPGRRIGTLAFLLGLGAVVSASVLVFWVTR